MNQLLLLGLQESTQWSLVWVVGVALFVGLIVFSYTSRSGIIARATTKEAVRQPLFFLIFFMATVLLVLNTFIPFFTLGDDIRELKNTGLSTLLISGILLAVWTAGNTITSEIEGKTAMTLLSKPINRRQFIIGKYLGILQGVLCLLIPLTLIFSFLIYYKVGFENRANLAGEIPGWFDWIKVGSVSLPGPNMDRLAEITQVLPGIILAFFQIAVLTGISVAVATRLPMIANLINCFVIFIIGNLTPQMVAHSKSSIENEQAIFVARLVATIMPSLNSFDIYGVLARGGSVPPTYLATAMLYAVAYVAATILFAFILFEDRDLA